MKVFLVYVVSPQSENQFCNLPGSITIAVPILIAGRLSTLILVTHVPSTLRIVTQSLIDGILGG
jgi:hypothetical protein